MTDGISESPATPDVVVESAPISAPVIDTPPDSLSVNAAPEPTPATEAAPSAEPASAAESENILGDAAPETKHEAEAKPEEKAPVETPPEAAPEVVLPTYEEFKLPENYSADKEAIGEFSKLLGELEVAAGKLDHAGYQEVGQKLIDLGTKNVQASIERLNEYYANFHENQKKEWFESFKKDPDMGGEKLQGTVSELRKAVEQYGGTPEQVAEFRQIMKDTGVGNHPALSRLLYNMQQKINKYETESDNGNGGNNRIVPASKPAPTKVKNYQQFYGGGS